MRILCPFVEGMLRDETAEALAPWPKTTFAPIPADDPYAYGNLLARAWAFGNDDLLIVEQDILPSANDIELMRTCPEPYCAATYEWKTDVGPALGFTRFRREFMQKYPSVMLEASRRATWKQLDVTLQRSILVAIYEEQPHIHPQVTHLNAEKKLMEGASPIPLERLPAW